MVFGHRMTGLHVRALLAAHDRESRFARALAQAKQSIWSAWGFRFYA